MSRCGWLAVWMAAAGSMATAASAGDCPAPSPDEFPPKEENRLGLVFTGDGRRAFWAAWNGAWGADPTSLRTILESECIDGAWTAASVAAFSGQYNDDDPFISPDDRWLYFVSDRGVDGPADRDDTNIWRFALDGSNRLEAVPVNSNAPEFSPVVTRSGKLYFSSARPGGAGQGDIYVAEPNAEGYSEPRALGPAINSPLGEWNVWVSADDSQLLFEASSRPTNVSVSGDIYYSWKSNAGWSPAVPVTELNSAGSDLMPRLHPDGRTLYFGTSAMGGHARMQSVEWPSLASSLRRKAAPGLLVANRSSHEFVVVDLARAVPTRRYRTGQGPHLLSNVSGSLVAATGFGEFPRPHVDPVAARPPFETELNSRLTIVDLARDEVVADSAIANCRRPHASWIVGQRLFVTCQDERRIAVLDATSGGEVASIETGQDGAHVIAHGPKTGLVGVTNTESGALTLIDPATGEFSHVALAAGTEGLLAVENRFWVANALTGAIAIVDAASGEIIRETTRICGFPIALSASPESDVWIACFGSSELVALDRRTHRITQRIDVDGQPLHVLVHPTRALVYASLPRANAVIEIDIPTASETRRFEVGIEPDGLRWAPALP